MIIDVLGHLFDKDTLSPEDVIIDAGASLGGFITGLKIVKVLNKTICIEPDMYNLKYLREFIKDHKNDILIERALVGNAKQKSVVFTSYVGYSEWGNIGDDYAVSANTRKIVKDQYSVPTITLQETIDLYNIKSIGLLKMDVEGSELNIIENMDSKLIKQVSIEYHRENEKPLIIDALQKLGFNLNFCGHEIWGKKCI